MGDAGKREEYRQDLKEKKIVTLYTTRVIDRTAIITSCISLLSVVGKLFARVVLRRLQDLAEEVYPEFQCGFRKDRSRVNMVITLCLEENKNREQYQPTISPMPSIL